MSRRNLFGGAIVADIPSSFIDASCVFTNAKCSCPRRVVFSTSCTVTCVKSPATKKYFSRPTRASASSSRSWNGWMKQIQQRQSSSVPCFPHLPSSTAGAFLLSRYHFASLAHDNDAESSTVHSVSLPALDGPRQDARTPTPITLEGEQRVAKFSRPSSDLVCVLMALYRLEDENVDLVVTANVPLTGEDAPRDQERVKEQFGALLTSLRILDFSLFG